MTGIDVAQVSKHYPLPEGEKTALASVNLSIKAGEFICLLGPSGCGKTTLLNILSGLDRDFEGEVHFIGSKPEPVVSYMFQESRLLPWLKVKDNLRFVLDKNAAVSEQLIGHWLKKVGLEGTENYYPTQLSVGMQQRVAVARALIIGPDVLFMDEPFSSLDELTASKMRFELLALWREQGFTVVFVTHNPLEAVLLADRVLIMTPSPGRIVEDMNVKERFSRPRDPEDPRLWQLSREAVKSLTASISPAVSVFQ